MVKDTGITLMQEEEADDEDFLEIRPSKRVIQGDQPHTFLGKSLAVGDFDGDGKEELFIGAPGYASQGMS